MIVYHLVVTLHLLAAVFWLGGMFFFGIVGAPVLRRLEPESLRRELFMRLGEGFRGPAWVSLAVLLVTGVWNLHLRSLLTPALSGDTAFWGSALGGILAWKLALVALMLTIQSIHDFSLGPKAGRAPAGSEEATRTRRRAALLGRLNGALALVLVYVAVRLARGG